MIRRHTLVLLAIACTALPSAAAAQVFTPSYLAPRGGGNVGAYISDTFDDAAVEGILRLDLSGYDVGVRPGVVFTDDPLLLVGVDLRSPLRVDAAPLDFAFAGALQGAFGDISALGVSAGLVVGSTISGETVSITPYLHPRVAVVAGDDVVGDDTDVEVLADLGFDVRLQTDLIFKLAFTFNDVGSSFGFGLAWR